MTKGRKPEIYILGNECSQELKNSMNKYSISFQRVPPHVRRRNAAERAIQTCKHHFIAGLATAHPDYPRNEWNRLFLQAILTLNHLRNARVNPNLSVHAFLYGMLNFISTPLAPPGTKVVIHIKPKERNTWGQCVRCHIPTTRAKVDSDTVQFFPHSAPIPQTTTTDFLKQAATDMLTLLQQ